MGYKRMKKRVYLSDRVGYKKWLKNKIRKVRSRMNDQFVEIVLAGNPTPNYSFDQNTGVITLLGDDAERMKWFESPNASGYLDM